MNKPVPIVMYHTVGVPNKKWEWHHLTIPVSTFESQLKALQRNGYTTITLSELYEYIFNSKAIPKKSVILTFDDGYLDNWVFVYPLLRKYKARGTIFINPEFANPQDIKRPRYDQNPSLITETHDGFLSWPEMLEMERSGLVDIQSHALTHTWYETSDEVIDFRHPGDQYNWLTWNNHKDKKPFLHIDDPKMVCLGEPVYRHEKSLACKRYLPNKKLKEEVIKFVNDQGSESFFENLNWKSTLREKYSELLSEHGSGRFETPAEQIERFEQELKHSRDILEQKLNKKIDFLCWPGGGACKESVAVAEKYYKMSTAARDIAGSRKSINNSPSMKSDRYKRISPHIFWNGRTGEKAKMFYTSGFAFIKQLEKFGLKSKLNFPKIYLKVLQMCYSILYK